MPIENIQTPPTIAGDGSTFSAVQVNSTGITILNAADERRSDGEIVPAGTEPVVSVRHDTGSVINASYLKAGVIDASLMRTGLLQTVPSWNTKWSGAPEDHAAVQMGFAGGNVAATGVSTSSGTITLALPSGHGIVTSDYIRVSGLYFNGSALLGGVGLNLPTNGPVDYASATVLGNNLTYSKSDITSGLLYDPASTVYVAKVIAISSISRVFDATVGTADLSTVTVVTSAAHGLVVGNYVEIAGSAETLDGVWYVATVPDTTTFTFKQRFGEDLEFDGTLGAALPSLYAPVVIPVVKTYTQNADGSVFARNVTLGGSTSITGGDSSTNARIALDSTPSQTGASIVALPVGLNEPPVTATAAKSSTTITVTSNAHGLSVGTYVSTYSSNTNLVVGTARVKTVATNTFTITKPNNTTAVSAGTTIYWRKYANIQYYAGGIHQFYGETLTGSSGASTGSPGAVLAGSLALGATANANAYGTSGLDVLADGELGFLTATTPVFLGGANLYSSDGTGTLNTSGAFTAGSNVTGDRLIANGYFYTYHGAIYLRGGTVSPTVYFRNSANTDLGNLSHNGANFTMSDTLAVTGSISATSSVTATGAVYVGATSGVYFGSTPNIYYSTSAGYFVVNDDLRVNVTATSSSSDLYINSTSAYGTLARFSSARRYKKDIDNLNISLGDVIKLRPVTFKWNPETAKTEDTGTMTGLIAEEVEAISEDMKRICRYNEETGEIESVQYSQLPVFLIGAIKELASKNQALETRIAELEAGA
jgi:hypothetical protein